MPAALGYTIKGSLENVYPGGLSNIIEVSKDTRNLNYCNFIIALYTKARYDEQCLGHFGLADEYYTHFSAIRRYPDLIVHRLIKVHVRKSV